MIEWRTLGSFSILDLTTNKYKRPKKVSFFMPRSLLFARFTKHQRISSSNFLKIFYKFNRNSLLANKKGPFLCNIIVLLDLKLFILHYSKNFAKQYSNLKK